MQFKGFNVVVARRLAAALDLRLENVREKGTNFDATFRRTTDRWRRESFGYYAYGPGRGKMHWVPGAVCYHGHYALMMALFATNNDGKIISAMARYDGLDDFLSKAPELAYKNIGSQMYPMYFGESCECDYCAEDAWKDALESLDMVEV